jgi:hypothetical protein
MEDGGSYSVVAVGNKKKGRRAGRAGGKRDWRGWGGSQLCDLRY